MEFSPAIYKRLLGFYEDKFEISRGNELQGQISDQNQAEILYKGWDFVKKKLSIFSDFLWKKKLSKYEKLQVPNDKIEVFLGSISKMRNKIWETWENFFKNYIFEISVF